MYKSIYKIFKNFLEINLQEGKIVKFQRKNVDHIIH